ncbi:MAG: HlyD family efflux transporter periplasmic adaptor subunit [Phycisphaerae bacterium]|nr:HlyD family efflux transporter periplasmic adaptor subunit [Phycisphaerae bacterium]
MIAYRNVVLVVMVRSSVLLFLVGAGSLVFWLLVRSRPVPMENTGANELRRVVTTKALEIPIGRRWKAYGTAQAIDSADVPAQVSATIESVSDRYRPGSVVTKGALLMTLDESDFRRELAMTEQAIVSLAAQLDLLAIDETTTVSELKFAEEELELARADFVRVEQAKRDGAAVDREVDRLRGGMIIASRIVMNAQESRDKIPARRQALIAERTRQESARDLAKANLDRCSIRSPLDGILQVANQEVGEMVTPGMRVARVVSTEAIEVPLLLPASARPFLRVDSAVALRSEGIGATPIDARITRISPEDDPLTRTLTVYAETDHPTPIAPGSFVDAEVSAAGDEVRTVLPRRAVSGGRALVVANGRVQHLQVEVEFAQSGLLPQSSLPDTEWVVLRDRLPAGTEVVLDGSRQIVEGTAIIGVESDPSIRAEQDGATLR